MPGRDGDRPITRAAVSRFLRAAFTERLGYKVAALFFAVVLWLVVSAEEPSEELVPVRVEAQFDSMRTIAGGRPVIRALVAGRARDLIKLYDTPPVVRRVVTDDEPDSVAVELHPEDVYIPPDVDAIVRDVQPRNFVLVFDVSAARAVPVVNAVRVVVDSGVAVFGEPRVRLVPDSVVVKGPRRAVRGVTSVQTVEQTVTVRDSGDFVIPIDTKRLGDGLQVRPSEVRLLVHLPLLARSRRDSIRVAALHRR